MSESHPAEGKRPPADLAARLDGILAAAGRLIVRIPDERMDWKPPERDRTLRDLAFHLFRLGLAFADGMDMGRLPVSWLQAGAPPDIQDGPGVARYGALVRGRLSGWFEGAGPGEYTRVIDVPDGPLSGHDLLERTTRHAARHLRQLHALLQRLGIGPLDPLPDLDGLSLPPDLW